jgi:hypothetical protein
MRSRVLALVPALSLALTGALGAPLGAQAQEDEEEEYYFEKESSAYVELYGAGGYFVINEEDKGSGGVGLTIGGHITEHFAMDATYEFQSQKETHLASYGLKYVFLTERIQPYVKVGIGLMGGRPDNEYLFMGRFDAGVTYFLNEQLAIRGGVSYAAAKDDNNLFLGSVGLVYYLE